MTSLPLSARRIMIPLLLAPTIATASFSQPSCLVSTGRRSSTATLAAIEAALRRTTDRLDALEAEAELQSQVAFFATMKRTPLSLDEVVEKCSDRSYRADIFCHRELPVLLAHMIKRLDEFPLGLSALSETREVKRTLLGSFERLTKLPVPGPDRGDTASFVDAVRDIDARHDNVVIALAKGVITLRKTHSRHSDALKKAKAAYAAVMAASAETHGTSNTAQATTAAAQATSSESSTDAELQQLMNSSSELQSALDAFYMDLLTYKFLSRQLITMHEAGGQPTTGFTSAGDEVVKVGMIVPQIDLRDVARKAAHQAELVCCEHYGDCPKIRVVIDDWNPSDSLAHLEDTIVYIIVELLKNSLRATVESQIRTKGRPSGSGPSTMVNCDDMPPVVITLSSAASSATIVVSDQGGGIPRREVAKAMSYAYTTVSKPALEHAEEEAAPSLLAGYGYGLPMSRLYARLFGGDLALHSMEGYGTDVYVTFGKRQRLAAASS